MTYYYVLRARMLTTILLIGSFFLATHSIFAAECPRVNLQDLKSSRKSPGELKIIFFASWCASCKPHFQTKYDDNTVFVAVFDEQKAAEKVIRAFGVKSPCFTSDGIAEELGVRALPATRTIQL